MTRGHSGLGIGARTEDFLWEFRFSCELPTNSFAHADFFVVVLLVICHASAFATTPLRGYQLFGNAIASQTLEPSDI